MKKIINYYIKRRGTPPDNYYNLLNLYLFPILTLINTLVCTYLFSKQIQVNDPSFIIDNIMMNKILVFTIIFSMWIIFPLMSLIRGKFTIERSNTMFFGSLMLYNLFFNNLIIFYTGFFLIASRSTTYGIKFKDYIKDNKRINDIFYKVFPKIKEN